MAVRTQVLAGIRLSAWLQLRACAGDSRCCHHPDRQRLRRRRRTRRRDSFHEDPTPRHDVLGEFAKLAPDSQFTVPVARTFPLEDWRTAVGISQSGHARGELVLMPASTELVS